MKVVLSDLFAPANETISCANIPWGRPPCQAGNGTITGKGNIFEVLSNRLCVTKIVVLAYKAIEDFLKGSPPYLFKVDGQQIVNTTMNRRLIDGYPGGFLSVSKRVGRGEFSGWQLNEAFRFQEKHQASADHILEEPVRLSPVPFPANFLRNEAPAPIRVSINDPSDSCYIVGAD